VQEQLSMVAKKGGSEAVVHEIRAKCSAIQTVTLTTVQVCVKLLSNSVDHLATLANKKWKTKNNF
jgi:hypothetical protein